jgi:hypothetical protein
MHRDLVEALREGELQSLCDWLSDHQVETGTLRELPQWGSSLFPDFLPTSRRLADRTDRAAAEVLAQLPKAATAPGGVPLLLIFVLLSVEAAWEVSYHYQPMWDTLRGARMCLREHGASVDHRDVPLTQAVLALTESLEAQIEAENAMTTGQLAYHQAALEKASLRARDAAESARGSAGEYPRLTDYIVDRSTEYTQYNSAVSAAVRGLRAFYGTGEPLQPVMDVLQAKENGGSITDPVFLSELRAHRFSLAALDLGQHEPWLRIDQGKIVYLYPFAVRGVSPRTVVTRADEDAAGWRLGGVRPVAAHGSLNLDDVWDGSDWFKRCYEGAAVELPDLVIRGADGQELARVEAQVRFSRLGNHYVRFSSDIENAMPWELYTMMLRGAPEHGNVKVFFPESPHMVWPRLSDLAVQLAEDACERLRENDGLSEAQAVARQGMFQVVVCVDEASTTMGPAGTAPRSEVPTAGALLDAVGAQVLTNPVTYLIGSLAEWVRYATDNEFSSTMTGLTGERTVATSNTTVITALGSAAFTQGTRRSVAEFAASLDGLFEGWSLELAEHYRRVSGYQDRVDEAEQTRSATTQTLTTLARELDAEKIRLNDFATDARSTIALIKSPSLLSSPVVADGLRILLERSGFPRRVAELNAMIEEVAHEQLGATLEKLARQRQEQEAREEDRRESKQRAKLEVFLAVIAAAGISGIIQVLQAGFFQSRSAAGWAVAGVSAIISVAVFLGHFFWPRGRWNT